MSVDRAVQRAVASSADLVHDTAASVPKAWGALAARGVVSFRELTGRPPTETERRAIWSGLWETARRAHATDAPATCGHDIDPERHGICEVCRGMLLCEDCARTHYCTNGCASRGCIAGLCVREVRDGVVSEEYGVG